MDRNALDHVSAPQIPMSLSARRAWIEIVGKLIYGNALGVALRKESVDRNRPGLACSAICTTVALRKESVDRNRRHEDGSLRLDTVALRKESVDRNVAAPCVLFAGGMSLSARRAWNVSLSDCSGWFCSCGYPL